MDFGLPAYTSARLKRDDALTHVKATATNMWKVDDYDKCKGSIEHPNAQL